MDNGLLLIASVIGVIIGSLITIVSLALLRKDAPRQEEEATLTLTLKDAPIKKKPGRPKKVKI